MNTGLYISVAEGIGLNEVTRTLGSGSQKTFPPSGSSCNQDLNASLV